jgi:hypothetical protein
MRTKLSHRNASLALVLLVGGLLCLAPAAIAATDPITVAFATTGTPAFGATVSVKATVTINDGSELQSMAWSQAGGATAVLAGTDTDTVSVTLNTRNAYRNFLIEVLGEAPITDEEGEGEEFVGGLQNRFQVVAINPLAEEHASATVLELAVVTTSGTYHKEYDVVTPLPWPWATGLRDVPVGLPVVLHGKTQATYNWALAKPTGSTAALAEATTQSPEFTPDMPGIYTVTVSDLGADAPASLVVTAGLWKGIITGQDGNGRPTVDTTCTQCHTAVPELDKFTPWAQTGHAEIFTNNVNVAGHYSSACFNCHMVGFEPRAANNGVDDQSDYAAMMASGLVEHGAAGNWTQILAQFPNSAREANIQCENCHGPQNSQAHYKGDGARVSLSSDVCGTCHGEPLRHGRFQQWQLSGHANYELAGEEGTNGSCAKCHSAQGFLAWLPVLLGEVPGDPNANLNVTWTKDEVHPQTCATCHDPHAIGTTTGSPNTNATVRISGDTPMLLAGFQATNVGRGAICLTCHNTRRGLKNDQTWNGSDSSRAPHPGAQADILMSQNLYFVEVGARGNHSLIEDACVTCHMEKTPPPADLSYQLGGTNHQFGARADICSKCHSVITTESVQGEVEVKLEQLNEALGEAIHELMASQIALGKKIAVGTTKTITDASTIDSITLSDASGRQAITVYFKDGTSVGPVGMNSVKAVSPNGTSAELYTLGPAALPKAGWNWCVIEADSSLGVHNPTFVKRALDLSIYAVTNAVIGGEAGNVGDNGGPGGGFGAVSCATPYVYWAEIATHAPGANESQWRTDMVARNLAASTANLKMILHTANGNFETTGTVAAGAQSAFEDVVAKMGQSNAKGSMEICSSQPLLVLGRIFNVASAGTFGQFLDGHVANLGLSEGETASLIGLRQQTGAFRTNISVTNGGTAAADIEVKLYDNAGALLHTYNLAVPAGQVVQDLTPFATRAGKPEVGWGFATVKVVAGFNINASASVIDAGTNDPVTIPAKQ